MSLPPRWVRRVLLAPLVVVLGVSALASTPVIVLVLLAVTSLVPRRFRAPRVLWLALVYVVWDAALLVVLFALWVASGFGAAQRRPAFVRAHYRVGAAFLRALLAVFRLVLRLRLIVLGSEGTEPGVAREDFRDLLRPDVPLVVLSRHGGPGDSFLLVHTLLNEAHRMPRIVLKDTLQWDPGIDVLLNRLPTRFIAPTGFGARRTGGGHRVEQRIGELATGMAAGDAVVIFPEGGQVSARRRESRAARYRAAGRDDLARRTEVLRHVMPPQPGGVYAALAAAPEADVVLIAHTGLDRFVTIGDIWRALPMDKRLTMRAVRVPRSRIPDDREGQAEWLFDWFEGIDAWVEAQDRVDQD